MKKSASGLYRTKVLLGHDRNGKAIYKWISGHTVKEIERKKDEVKKAYVTGADVTAGEAFANDAIEDWLAAKANVVGNNTYLSLRTVARRHVEPKLEGKRIKAVRRSDLQEIMNALEGYSREYSTEAMSILRGVFSIAYSDGLIAIDPSLHLKKPKCKPQVDKRALTDDERKIIEDVALTNVPLAILYYTGMRLGELRALSWADIDLSSDTIHITKSCGRKPDEFTPGKTKNAVRDVPIVPQLKVILRKYQGLPTARIFGVASFTADRIFRKLFSDLKLDITAHYLRHNFVTLCWERNIDVMITSKIVGHSSPVITMGIYTHLDKQHGKQIHEKVSDLFSAVAK